MRGCIHIYTGDGKGKTTAATGLSVRFAGSGGNVLFSQFMKDGSSGEIAVLKNIPHITVKFCEKCFGFSFQMNEEQKKQAALYYSDFFDDVIRQVVEGGYGLLILDEIISTYNLNFIPQEKLVDFLKNKPQELEVVLTGRNPAQELVDLADYISEIKKIKHPFDAGIPARDGIEQ